MSDPSSKVVVFGSFSEDETRAWKTKTNFSVEKLDTSKRSQDNSPSHMTRLIFGCFDTPLEPDVGFHKLTGETYHGTSKYDKDLFDKSNIQPFPTIVENGIVHDSNNVHLENQDIVDGNNINALKLSEDNREIDGKSKSEFPDNGSMKLNGIPNHTKVELQPKAANGMADAPVLDSTKMLHRGLINSGNLCFLNAILQALLACSPFVQLLQGLRNRNIAKVRHPTLVAFVEFIAEFDAVGGSNPRKKDASELEVGRPFSPIMFEEVLRKFTPDIPGSISRRARQEDAQEFLSFIMDQMHDELLRFEGKSYSDGTISSLVSTSEDDEWETVGRKNKSAVTRTQKFVPSELNSIFCGALRSVVNARGNKPSATDQPFRLLHLDISHEAIQTINDALRFYSAPERLDEYRSSTAGKVGVVVARKSVNIQALPKILILHLKRFGYGNLGSTKLHKLVHFPLDLVLSRNLLVSSTVEGRRYELISTVTHHGREASKGHYTADVRTACGRWLRFDDATVHAVGTNQVLHDQAYILFYKQL